MATKARRSRGRLGISCTTGPTSCSCSVRKRDNLYESKFGNAAATDGSDYPSVAELSEAWQSVADDFGEVLASKSEEEFDSVSEGGAHDERSLRDQVVFFAWHEGYHLGVVGSIRKSLGMLGPAEKVMALREAEAEQE